MCSVCKSRPNCIYANQNTLFDKKIKYIFNYVNIYYKHMMVNFSVLFICQS